MTRYEVWGRGGLISSHADKALANKAFRRQDAPAALTLGASVLAVRDGTTPKQRAAIEHAVALAHAGDAKIVVPQPDPTAPKTHRTPLVTRRPVEVDAEDEETDVEAEEPETGSDDADDDNNELPTADAPRDPPADAPAVERPAVVAAPAQPLTPEVPMASKSVPSASGTPCAARGCVNTIPPRRPYQRPGGVSWRTRYCRVCCDRARHAIKAGRTTVETLAAYLDRTDRRDTSAATAARLAKRSSGTTAKKPAAVASPVATSATSATSDADTIQVTIALPSAVARAYRCALSVGGVEALERLIAALPTTVRP